MSLVAAETCFRRGLAALVSNRPREAAELFGAAVRLERENRVHRPRMRYLSYLGLSMAQADGATPEPTPRLSSVLPLLLERLMAVRPAAKRIPVTCFTATAGCSSDRPSGRKNWAADPSPHCPSSRRWKVK